MPQQGARILIVDDEPQIRRFVSITLRAQGFAVAEATRAREAIATIAAGGIALVLFDLGLPDLDGVDAIRELRAWSQVPIIVVSVRAAENHVVAALDAGANDYVTKPFGIKELSARIRALLRQAQAPESPIVFDDGELKVDLRQRLVQRGGEIVSLSRKEWELLALLMRHQGQVVTHGQILREMWGSTHEDDTHYLRILVGRLRARLGESATRPSYIRTEAGVGFRFIGSLSAQGAETLATQAAPRRLPPVA